MGRRKGSRMNRHHGRQAGWALRVVLTGWLCSASLAPAQAPADPPKNATTLTAEVERALRAQDLPAAKRAYQAMLELEPRNSEAWTGLGVLLYGSGDFTGAEDALTRALSLDPATPRAALFLAFSRADLRQCDKAMPVLEHAFATEPVGKLHRLTGLTLLGCSTSGGDESLALRTATQLKQTYPGDADVLYQSAELYTRLWTESAEQLVAAHPDSFRVHQLAGEVNEAQGNTGQAIRQYRVALAENDRLPQLHFRIGQLLLKEGAPDADAKAMEEFRAELALHPRSAPAELAMAEIERHAGQLDDAERNYRLAAETEPGLVAARVGLAQTLLARHQVPQAQAELQQLLVQHPESAQAHYQLMLALRAQGKLPEAAAEMQTFQRLQQGSDTDFRDKLNALLSGSSNPAPANSPSSSPATAPEQHP